MTHAPHHTTRHHVLQSLARYLEAWRKRKALFRETWGAISEGLEGKQADLFEQIGVDSDEAVGADVKALGALLQGASAATAAAAAAGNKKQRLK